MKQLPLGRKPKRSPLWVTVWGLEFLLQLGVSVLVLAAVTELTAPAWSDVRAALTTMGLAALFVPLRRRLGWRRFLLITGGFVLASFLSAPSVREAWGDVFLGLAIIVSALVVLPAAIPGLSPVTFLLGFLLGRRAK